MDELANEIYGSLEVQRAIVMSENVSQPIKDIAWCSINFLLDRLLEIRLVEA